MTIIVICNQEAAGRTRQGIAPAQPCATRDSAQIKFGSVGRNFRAICRVGLFAHRQGRGGAGALKPGHLSLLNSFRPLKASGSLIQSGLECAVLQDPKRYLAKSFQVISSFAVGVAHMQQCNGGNGACPTKEFPISEKEFPRTI